MARHAKDGSRKFGRPTVLLCPQCNSVVYEYIEADDFRLRCRHGHAVTTEQVCPGIEEHLRNAWANVVRSLAFDH